MIEHVRKLISTLVTAVSKSVPLAKENGNAVVPGFTPSFGVLAALERSVSDTLSDKMCADLVLESTMALDTCRPTVPKGTTTVSPPSYFITYMADLSVDEVDFHEIEIPPTTDELISSVEAYMPANLPGAKHHLPTDSIDKM